MSKSLLAHIAWEFITEYENAANSSVAYLLNEYEEAREGLRSLLRLESVPEFYKTELGAGKKGRPDITGIGSNGNPEIIIEGKFWANLTKNQRTGYIDALSEQGCLLFLAPKGRIVSLKAELKGPPPDGPIQVHSWQALLNRIEECNTKNNPDLSSDLTQLRALCKQVDTIEMRPIRECDLDPMTGRFVSSLADLMDGCYSVLGKHPDFYNMRKASHDYGYGFRFYAYGYECNLRTDTQLWYSEDCHAPIWLLLSTESPEYINRIKRLLKERYPNRSGEWDCQDKSVEYGIGILLEADWDEEKVFNEVLKQVGNILTSTLRPGLGLNLASDLVQLRHAGEQVDAIKMPPISKSDLDPEKGRFISNLADLMGECKKILKLWEPADFDRKKTTPHDYGYGFYFYAYGYECYLGTNTQLWCSEPCHAPIWLELFTDDSPEHSSQIERLLKERYLDRSIIDEHKIGIPLEAGWDEERTVNEVLKEVKDILPSIHTQIS